MRRNGFTLLELMIVVIIMGILASLAIPQFQGAVIKAKLSEIFPTVNVIAKAEEIYYYEHGRYIGEPEVTMRTTSPEQFENILGIIVPETGVNSEIFYRFWVDATRAGIWVIEYEGMKGLCSYSLLSRTWDYYYLNGGSEWIKYLNLPGVE